VVGVVEVEGVGEGSAEGFVGVGCGVVEHGVIKGLCGLPWAEIDGI